MEKENINFVAIDFETMTPELTSACAVGMVQVVNGVITCTERKSHRSLWVSM